MEDRGRPAGCGSRPRGTAAGAQDAERLTPRTGVPSAVRAGPAAATGAGAALTFSTGVSIFWVALGIVVVASGAGAPPGITFKAAPPLSSALCLCCQLIRREPPQSRARPTRARAVEAAVADTQFRRANEYNGSVYVLRIPSAMIPRRLLEATDDPRGMWLCRTSLSIEYCGVERFDLPEIQPQFEVIASSR